MDPNAAWQELTLAFVAEERDHDRVSELALGLLGWLDKGGFPPKISGFTEFDRFVAKRTCLSLANHQWLHGK